MENTFKWSQDNESTTPENNNWGEVTENPETPTWGITMDNNKKEDENDLQEAFVTPPELDPQQSIPNTFMGNIDLMNIRAKVFNLGLDNNILVNDINGCNIQEIDNLKYDFSPKSDMLMGQLIKEVVEIGKSINVKISQCNLFQIPSQRNTNYLYDSYSSLQFVYPIKNVNNDILSLSLNQKSPNTNSMSLIPGLLYILPGGISSTVMNKGTEDLILITGQLNSVG